MTPWGCEEAPTLYFKGSKPEAVPAGWSLFRLRGVTLGAPLARRVDSPSASCSIRRLNPMPCMEKGRRVPPIGRSRASQAVSTESWRGGS